MIVVCAVHTRPSTESRALLTNQMRTYQDVVVLFCPSFTQSERFLHTDQLITRLQVVVMINFIRMLSGNVIVNVFESDAVIWWAAIFCTPSSMFDKLLHTPNGRQQNCCQNSNKQRFMNSRANGRAVAGTLLLMHVQQSGADRNASWITKSYSLWSKFSNL